MNCTKCKSSKTVVKDSRPYKLTVRRRRECFDCGHRYSTIEMSADFFKRLEAMAHEGLIDNARPEKSREQVLTDLARGGQEIDAG